MTNKEIIKAMECLSGFALKCRECPYSSKYKFPLCQQQVAKDALDLIKNQQAEIKVLKSDYATTKQDYEHYKSVLEDKQKLVEKLNQKLINAFKLVEKAKTEAYKEFAERLKAKCHNYYPSIDSYCVGVKAVGFKDIDNLVKEVVGDNNEI